MPERLGYLVAILVSACHAMSCCWTVSRASAPPPLPRGDGEKTPFAGHAIQSARAPVFELES